MKKISFGFIAICIFCFNANAQNPPKKDNGGITPEKLESWLPVPIITPGNTNADAPSDAIVLFNGKDLTGWQTTSKDNQWVVKDGVLTSPRSGSNIRTEKTFNDFKLHIEFRYPKESNSGVYLRGRYEIQIEDNIGMEPMSLYLGGIYGFIDPWLNMAKAPGEWQSFDVELVGRMVTVIANGTTVIYKQEIPGVTGGALDSKEGEPGPLMMQGDHGPIEYRNIILTPAIN